VWCHSVRYRFDSVSDRAFLNGGSLLAAKIVGIGIKISFLKWGGRGGRSRIVLRFKSIPCVLLIRTELMIRPEGYGVTEGDGFG